MFIVCKKMIQLQKDIVNQEAEVIVIIGVILDGIPCINNIIIENILSVTVVLLVADEFRDY